MSSLGQPTRPTGPARLLRYRFESVEQASRHFHVVSGRVVLFYPSLLALRPAEPVLLYVSFASSEQHCRVGGVVIGKDVGGPHTGAWLEFPAHGIVESLQNAVASRKRRQRRYPTDIVINVESTNATTIVAKLIDIGSGGGRISGVSVRATKGDEVRLSPFSRGAAMPIVGARVAWVRQHEIGVAFNKPPPAERAAIMSLIAEARQNLANAYEATHPTFCRCETDAVAEPPLPRSAHRQGSL